MPSGIVVRIKMEMRPMEMNDFIGRILGGRGGGGKSRGRRRGRVLFVRD